MRSRPDSVEAMIVERHSVVDAPPQRVWARVVTPEGINDELRPWMTMSMPRGKESLTVDNVPVGTPVGRCWMRLFGALPFDYDDLMIAELWPRPRLPRGVDDAVHAAVAPPSARWSPKWARKPLSAIGSRSS